MAVNYFQLYGVEPFESLGTPLATPYGGGAKVTNDNFLITLWNVTQSVGGLPVAGDRIKPTWETPSGVVDVTFLYGPGATKNTFKSRLSTRFRLSGLEPVAGSVIFAILQTPRQDFNPPADPLAFVNPASPFGLSLNIGVNPMSVASLDAELRQLFGTPGPAVSGAPIFDVPINLVGIGMTPLLKTDGADGVFPQFYDFSSAPAAVAAINEIKRGAPVFLGAIIGPTVNYDALDVTLRWPHSSGRG